MLQLHYDNILMLNPIGMPIARIPRIRATWFVHRDLAQEYLLSEEVTSTEHQLSLIKFPKQQTFADIYTVTVSPFLYSFQLSLC